MYILDGICTQACMWCIQEIFIPYNQLRIIAAVMPTGIEHCQA